VLAAALAHRARRANYLNHLLLGSIAGGVVGEAVSLLLWLSPVSAGSVLWSLIGGLGIGGAYGLCTGFVALLLVRAASTLRRRRLTSA